MSDKKTSFKRKQSQNTKQVEYCELFETRSFGGEPLKVIQNRKIIRTNEETERIEQKRGDLPF